MRKLTTQGERPQKLLSINFGEIGKTRRSGLGEFEAVIYIRLKGQKDNVDIN